MKKKIIKRIIGAAAVCFLIPGILYMNNDIGVPAAGLEDDIRSSSDKVQEDWIVEGEISDTMAAFIAYSPDKKDHMFNVYVNRPGLSFGYFFREGGSMIGIKEVTVDGYEERAFISMNDEHIERIEIDDGNGVRVIELSENEPFAFVLPLNVGKVTFYDVSGNEYWRLS